MIIVTIFFIILIVFVIIIYYKTRPENNIPNEKNKQQPIAKNCGILDGSTITPCNINDPKSCINCQCSPNPSDILGCMSCQNVDENSIYKNLSYINKDSCTGKYLEWDGNVCKLKNGSYCLPKKMPDDIKCNNFTGTKVLTQDPVTLNYEYTCLCNSQNFSNIGTKGGDCNYIHLCGINSTQNPSNNRSLVNNNDNSLWTSDSQWNPNFDGKCLCGPDEVFVQNTMSCLPDKCKPFGNENNDKINCDCDPGYINCADISYRQDSDGTVYYTGDCVIPSCIPDPCVGVNGDPKFNYYSKSKNSCVCGDPNNPNNTWTNSITNGNGFNQVCVDVCSDVLNPCENRGKCYLYTENDGNIIWKIVTSNQYKGQFLISNTILNKYLKNDLTLSDSGDFFYIETSGTTDAKGTPSIFQCVQVFSGDKYCVKLDNSGNTYINFKTLTANNSVSNATVITLISDSVTKDDEYKILVGDTQYLSGNISNNKVSLIFPFIGTARCKDCNTVSGFVDDDQLLCLGHCTTSSNGCTKGDSSTCCPGLSCKYDWTRIEYNCL
jgi:hypothetical protein